MKTKTSKSKKNAGENGGSRSFTEYIFMKAYTPITNAIELAATDDTGCVCRMELIWEGLEKLERENARLREWIREEGERTNTCTYGVLREICSDCRCGKLSSANVSDHRQLPQ